MDMFFAQGGYAFYVWTSYGMALLLLVWELVQLGRRRRAVLARYARRTILARMRADTHGRPHRLET